MFKEFKSISNLNWIYFFILLTIFWIGEINLYSASGGSFKPWASNQLLRFILFIPIFFMITLLEPKFIYNFAEIFLILVLIGLIITLVLVILEWVQHDGLESEHLIYKSQNLPKLQLLSLWPNTSIN